MNINEFKQKVNQLKMEGDGREVAKDQLGGWRLEAGKKKVFKMSMCLVCCHDMIVS